MRQCNRCSRKGCDVLRMHKAGKRKLTTEQLQDECDRHIFLEKWKLPLLVLAIEAHPQGVHDVLGKFNFTLDEQERYPYFRLTI